MDITGLVLEVWGLLVSTAFIAIAVSDTTEVGEWEVTWDYTEHERVGRVIFLAIGSIGFAASAGSLISEGAGMTLWHYFQLGAALGVSLLGLLSLLNVFFGTSYVNPGHWWRHAAAAGFACGAAGVVVGYWELLL